MQLFHDYYAKIKANIIFKISINKMKEENKKFSISIDEWTSLRNRRYMNVHLHYVGEDSENLGLIRIYGSCPAEKIRKKRDSRISRIKKCRELGNH